jgi:hypothetical protein
MRRRYSSALFGATTLLVGAVVWATVSHQPAQGGHPVPTTRKVELRSIALKTLKTYQQATVKLRVTDGNGAPVDCQTTMDIAPMFDEGVVERMKSTTCPPRPAG